MLYLKPCKRSECLVQEHAILQVHFPFPFTNREMYLLIQMIRNCLVLKYRMCKILTTGPIRMAQSWSSEYVGMYAYFTYIRTYVCMHICIYIIN
jgi:hypothetical protein